MAGNKIASRDIGLTFVGRIVKMGRGFWVRIPKYEIEYYKLDHANYLKVRLESYMNDNKPTDLGFVYLISPSTRGKSLYLGIPRRIIRFFDLEPRILVKVSIISHLIKTMGSRKSQYGTVPSIQVSRTKIEEHSSKRREEGIKVIKPSVSSPHSLFLVHHIPKLLVLSSKECRVQI